MRKHAATVHGCSIQRLDQLPKKHGISIAALNFYSYQISQLDFFTHFVRLKGAHPRVVQISYSTTAG